MQAESQSTTFAIWMTRTPSVVSAALFPRDIFQSARRGIPNSEFRIPNSLVLP